MLTKIIRKAGMGTALVSLARPFIKFNDQLPAADEAMAQLTALSPDPGNSCLWDNASLIHSKTELDIIITAYNAEKYIAKCMESALSQQTAHCFRLIVIDDGSTDNTGAIIDSYAHDPRVLIKHQQNRGFSGARNAGLELSDAEYVTFLDSDDSLPADAIEALMNAAKENNAALAEGSFNTTDTDGKILSHVDHAEGLLNPCKDFYGFTCMKVIHRSLIGPICFPEGYWYEDSIMAQIIYPLAQKRKLSARGISDSVYNYTVNPSGISHTGRSSPKSIDSLWITLQLYKDRQTLGLENDQTYYEYILRMLVLSYRRAEAQSMEVKKAMFVLWKDFIDKEFSEFETTDSKHKILQQAVREGNFRLFCAVCSLI